MSKFKLLSELAEIMSKFPKGSKEAQEAIAAEMAARKAAQEAAYAPHTLPTEKGNKTIAKAKKTLIKPEDEAKLEAELREKGKQQFLEPSKVKERMYHGTNKDFKAFGHEHQYSGEGATHSGSGFYFTESPESASRYALMKGVEGANVQPVYLNIKKPLHFDWDKGEVTGANIKLSHNQVKKIIESAPNIRNADESPLTNWGDIRGKNFDKVLNEAVKSYADSSMLSALRNDFFLDDHASWLKALNKATGYDSATTVTPTGERHYIAWFPEQIKSSTGNLGTYDVTNPDITKADGGAIDAPDWYAQLGAMLQNPEPTWYDQLGEMMMAEGGSASLKDVESRQDLAPYGLRHSGEGAKGSGYFGPMRGREGVVTELSAEDDEGEYPLVVPTLTREELDHLLSGGEPTEMIHHKARSYAEKRKGAGKSPFADPSELRYPMPTERGYADGGQTFPLKDPEEEQRRRMMEGSDIRVPQKYPTLVKVGEGFKSAHEFISKPFGYENPPGEFVSELLGIPAVGKTLENIGYDMPLTTGAGMTSNLRPEVAEAALTALPVVGKAAQMTAKAAPKVAKKATEALAPTVADLLETQLRKSGMMMPMAPEGKAAKVKAPANDLGFYSTVEKAALNLQRKSGTGDSFLADLMKNPGVSESRLEEMGLTALRGKKNVTADEVRALASENRVPLTESKKVERNEAAIEELESRYDDLSRQVVELQGSGNSRAIARAHDELDAIASEQRRLKSIPEAKFGPLNQPDYNMPGGENYREIRVKLPTKRLTEDEARKVLGASPNAKLSEADITFASNKNKDQFFNEAHHGDEPNVLFHLRVAEHADAEGKRGLLIDELQSDWHQAGRDKGYGPQYQDQYRAYYDTPQGQVDIGFGKTPEELERMVKASGWDTMPIEIKTEKTTSKVKEGVPDAPFKDNWYQLGLKRAIKEATDSGMDRVYLTTGKTQNERYDLSKQLSSVSYQDGVLRGYDNSGALVVNKSMTPDDLPNYVGKDLGKKMVESAKKDAEIRNKISVAKYEGAPESQIDSLRSQLNDVKTDYVGVDLQVGGEGMKQYYDKTYFNWLKKYAKEHNAEVGMTKLSGSDDPVYFLDLTPKLKETAKKGQSYKRGGSIKHHKFSKELQKYAEGGTISDYNTSPDRSDGGLMILEKNGYA